MKRNRNKDSSSMGYRDTWESIKEHGTLTIRASPQFHARIKKALANVKSLDESWPERRYYALRSKVSETDPTKITFYLSPYRRNELVGEIV